jgi:hypothetical protein
VTCRPTLARLHPVPRRLIADVSREGTTGCPARSVERAALAGSETESGQNLVACEVVLRLHYDGARPDAPEPVDQTWVDPSQPWLRRI